MCIRAQKMRLIINEYRFEMIDRQETKDTEQDNSVLNNCNKI